MRIFTKKSIVQKIIIAIVAILIFNFIAPNISKAVTPEDAFGGVLFGPIQTLLLGLGDVGMYLSSLVVGEGFRTDNILTLSTSNETWYETAFKIVKTVTLDPIQIVKNVVGGLDYIGVIDAPDSIVPDKVDLPYFAVTPEKIFSNQVPFLDVNIINPEETESATYKLQSVISSWYLAFRNLAIIAMLCVLAYIGIRILISSTATDKAKYKEHLKDWLVAICLLFFMHYIMSFSLTMVEELTNSINEGLNIPIIKIKNKFELTDAQKEALESMGNKDLESKDGEEIVWPTDFAGVTRFRAQLNYSDGSESEGSDYVAESLKSRMAYSIMYIVLVMYTLIFLWKYLKRLVYMIFLTVIAPVVALTYPIDKINDGSAQAFNMWIKEYIYNLLLQPFHLILYSVLISSAIELSTTYLIYPLVVFGFMLQGEAILKKFFGFEKAGIGSSFMGGALSGAMVMQAIGKISSGVKGGKKVASGASSGETGESKVRMDNRTPTDGDGEEKFLMDALGGTNQDTNVSQESTQVAQPEEQYDNPFMEDYNEQEQLSPEEMAQQDPNYMYMHPELFSDDNNANQQNVEHIRENSDIEEKDNNMAQEELEDRETPKIEGPSTKKYSFKKKIGAALPIVGRGAMNVGKTLGKAAIKTYGAAALGTVGIAAGLASDKYENVFSYGVAGATAGSTVAGATMNKAKSLPSNMYRKSQEMKDEYMKNLYKDDPAAYKKYLNEQADEAFKRDKAVQKLYKDAFGEKERKASNGERKASYKVAMEEAMKYREHGVTDNKLIIKAMKANVKGIDKNDWGSSKRIAAAKYAEQVTSPKDIETLNGRLKNKGIGEENIRVNTDLVNKIKDFRY